MNLHVYIFQQLNNNLFLKYVLKYFFSVRLLSVLRGHSVFSSPPQRPMTSDFDGFSFPDFIHYHDFTIELIYIEGLMEDLLKCQISPLVKYRQNRWNFTNWKLSPLFWWCSLLALRYLGVMSIQPQWKYHRKSTSSCLQGNKFMR